MMVMVSANDLITLYLGLELQSLCALCRRQLRPRLGALDRGRAEIFRSRRARLGHAALRRLADLRVRRHDRASPLWRDCSAPARAPSTGLIIGLVFVTVGLAFKVSAVPFHMWTPDVYEGAPTPVTAFFSVAPKIAALALFVRFMIEPFGGLLVEWRQVVVFLSVASMVLGAVAAIAQENIKRLMAYSSIGHVGYALIGLAAATPNGIRGVLVYMAIYLFMNLGTWAVILCMRQKGRMLESISDLSGLGRTQPGLALALGIFMFALAGIPPTAGFFAKLYIFLAAIDANLDRARGDRRRRQRRRRVLLPAHRQGHVFRRAADRVRPAARARAEGACWSSPPC